jgi:hypothetical protein
MKIAYQNLTSSIWTMREIGTKLVCRRIQVPISCRIKPAFPLPETIFSSVHETLVYCDVFMKVPVTAAMIARIICRDKMMAMQTLA